MDGTAKEIELSSEKIEDHYDLIISASNGFEISNVTKDEYTTLSVKSDASSAHVYAFEMEYILQGCIKNDTANLKKLDVSFVEKDDNISEKIEEMKTE